MAPENWKIGEFCESLAFQTSNWPETEVTGRVFSTMWIQRINNQESWIINETRVSCFETNMLQVKKPWKKEMNTNTISANESWVIGKLV